MIETPGKEPVEFYAGDTVKWRRDDLSDYPASAGWLLKYHFRGPSQPATVTAVADGNAFTVLVAASVTKDWNEGIYWWAAKVSKAGEEYTVSESQVLVKLNYADPKSTYDGRSHAKITLDNLEATIQRLSAQDLSQYSIAQRTAVRQRLEELVKIRAQYKAEYNAEQAEVTGRKGGKVLARF